MLWADLFPELGHLSLGPLLPGVWLRSTRFPQVWSAIWSGWATGLCVRRSARATGLRGPCGGRAPRSSRPAPRAANRPSTAAMLIQRIVAGDVETGRLGHEPRGEVHLCSPCVPRLGDHLGSATAPSKSPSRSVSEQNSRGTSCPAISSRNVARSISARCRTNPRSDIVDGSTERRAIASASSPEHFISN
jgi:hypothetical protein